MLENALLAWFKRWHGTGAKNQTLVYRCESCHKIVTHRHISTGGCPCNGIKLRPTNPSLVEKFRLLVLPWTV